MVKRSQRRELLAGLGVRHILCAAAALGGCNAIAGIHEATLDPCADSRCGAGGAGEHGAGGQGGIDDAASTALASTSTSTGRPASASCGDGIIDPGEECDDQNSFPHDGCTACEVDCEGQGAFKAPGSHHCYWVNMVKLTFLQAGFACKVTGSYLAAITSAEERSAVAEHIQEDTWIGADDLAVEGMYVWSDGEPWVFAPWKPGEPSGDVDHHDCIKLTGSALTFDDDDCIQKRVSLCERPPIGELP